MGTSDISFLVAFLAGIVSFVSPCILPLIPAYLSYITGTIEPREKSLSNTLSRSLAFVLGFSIIFIIMGASASYLGQLFLMYRPIIIKISGILIIVFGLHMMGILKIPLLYKQFRLQGPSQTKSFIGAILLGMAFAAGWTPCIGTVLSSILLYASITPTVTKGIYLLIAYSLGLGIPFILVGVITHYFGNTLTRFNRWTLSISKIAGAVMVVLGIMMFFDLMSRFTQLFYF